MSKKIIILEELNLISLIYLILFSYLIHKIFVFKSNQIINEYIRIKKNNYIYKLFKFFFKKKIIKIDTKTLENLSYNSNYLSNNFLKKKSLNIINTSLLEKKIKSNKYFIALKKYLIPHVQSKFRLYLIYRYLEKNYKNEIVLVGIYEDYLKIFTCSKKKKINFIFFQNLFYKINSIKIFIKVIILQFIWLFKICINGFHFKNKIKNYDYAYHIAYGIKKNQRDYEVLCKLKNKKLNLLLVHSIWRHHNTEIDNEIKFDSCDEFRNSVNLFYFFKKILATMLKLNLNFFRYNYLDFEITYKILLYYFNNQIFCQNYRVKNFISRDDYSVNHIIRTIVFNEHDLKNVGIQHSAFMKPLAINYIIFTYFDKYFTYNNINKLIYDKFSYSKEVIPVGTIHVDSIIKNKDTNKIDFEKLYSNSKNIVIFFPSLYNPFIDYKLLNKKYEFLIYLLERKEKFNIFIQLRKKELRDFREFFKKFEYLKNYENQLIFETKFSTAELINYADVVVTNDSSTITLEALSIKQSKIVLLNSRFQYNKILPWHDIEPDFVCQTSKEVKNKIEKILLDKNYNFTTYPKIFIDDLFLKKKNIWDKIISHL